MPQTAAKLIQEKSVSLCFDFPPILSSILKAATEEHLDIRSLRAVAGLGTPEVIEQLSIRNWRLLLLHVRADRDLLPGHHGAI